ncbi:MAG: cupin domain-containing protein [Acidobacteria bacterium]|nr:cupin domain-containing protein [Acidobacteriota bacterium]
MKHPMKPSRREVPALLTALTGLAASAQTAAPLPSRAFRFEDLPVRANGKNRSRAVLNGLTHSGFPVEMHQTELGPGMEPHPPHSHINEELLMLREGTLEVTISGQTTTLGPGGSVYVASGEVHGWRNPGESSAHYFVIALGAKK